MDQEQEAPLVGQPIPARFWWLKRIPLAVVILLIPLAGLRWWWGVYAERAYRAEIERYRAAGEPISSEDFDLPPVPDEQNAALLYEKAIAGLSLTKDQKMLIHKVAGQENILSDDRQEIEAILEASKETLSLCRQARELEGVNWGLIDRGLGGTPPSLMPHDELATLLVASAIWLDQNDRCEEAVQTLLDALAYGRKISAFRALIPSLLEHHISKLTGLMIEDHSGTWKIIADDALDSDPTRQVSRRQIRKLVDQLTDEHSVRDGFTWGVYTERLLPIQSAEMFIGDYILRGHHSPLVLFMPAIRLDGIRVLRFYNKWIEATKADNYPRARERFPQQIAIRRRSIQWHARILCLLINPTWEPIYELHFETLALRRMAAVTLAVRLYESDHGRRPETLEELVPAYLSEILEDPFADDGRKIGYRPEDNPPALFSIGPHQSQYGDISCIRFTLYGTTTTQPETSPSGA